MGHPMLPIDAVLLPNIIDGTNMWMRKIGQCAGLALKALPQVGSFGKMSRQDLDGHLGREGVNKFAKSSVGNARRCVPCRHIVLNSNGFLTQIGTEQRPFPTELPIISYHQRK